MGEKMKEWPDNLRPYEKVMAKGAEALDDAELLAVILKSGAKGKNSVEVARELLKLSEGLYGLHSLSMEEFMSVDSIGSVKAITLQCVVELAARLSASTAPVKPALNSPQAVAEQYMERMRHEKQEVVRALYLDAKCRLIADEVMSRGSVNMSLMPLREVLIKAVRSRAVYMVLLHNHPSGDPSPSPEDIESTLAVLEGASKIGIGLMDHVIIGDHCYYSFSEQGLLE